jgi:uncharacterized protein (DUF952 family)
MTLIYHITTRSAELQARQSGEYRAESLASDGFIHCSQVFQILGVANAFYAGQNDLVILVIDPLRLKSQTKFEAPVHPRQSASAPASDNLFPHVYGPINFNAVDKVVDLPMNAHGGFDLPASLYA